MERAGVTPDLMTVGKGIGGGVAVAAVMGRAEVMDWPPDSYTSTFLTNNLNSGGGDRRHRRAARRAVWRSGRRSWSRSVLLRLRTALAGVAGRRRDARLRPLVRHRTWWSEGGTPAAGRAAAIVRRLRAQGVLVGRSGYDDNVIKLSPPLVIDEERARPRA